MKKNKRTFKVPREFWLTNGTGQSDVSELNAFDAALISGKIGNINLLPYSSILPLKSILRNDQIQILEGTQTGVIIANQKGRQAEIISTGIVIAKANTCYIVYEAHLKESKMELEKLLVNMITEAFVMRDEILSDILIISSELNVRKKYGCSISAIVFDPLSYE